MGRVKWTQYGRQIILLGFVLALAWLVRQTQGAAILEVYYWLSRPFQAESPAAVENRLRNARIVELEQQVAELQQQNQQLKQLLKYSETQKQLVITAPIIGRSASEWWKQVTLGRGSQDDIEAGFVVLGVGGLVGRIIAITPHTSRVLLVSDPTSQVGANISRSRSMGVVKGKGSQLAAMQFFEKVPDVRPGDVVVTSSVSRLYPGGLPIGRIKSVNLESGTAPEAVVELTAPIDDLEWTIVRPFKRQ